MNLIEKTRQAFLNFNQIQHLFDHSDKILVAVSGGMDSMMLLDLYRQCRFSFGVAHCNYGLRGEASDLDEALVKTFCETHSITFHSHKFNTAAACESLGKGIQETARILRYKYFDQLCDSHQYTKIATAHHKNDNLETFLFNFGRSSGIRGLSGIPLKREKIIRPLLFIDKASVKAYSQEINLTFREDESNVSEKYNRNKIRHQIIPALEAYDPKYIVKANKSIMHLQETYQFLNQYLDQEKAKCVKQTKGQTFINKAYLQKHFAPISLLKELIRPYGYKAKTCEKILKSLDETGALFKNKSYFLLVDRTELILEENKPNQFEITIKESDEEITTPHGSLTINNNPTKINFARGNQEQYINADRLTFPLTLRSWKKGDKFQPLGMGGNHQSVREFFINQKVNRLDKKRIPILVSNGEIVSIIGFRIDERFKLEENRGKVIGLTWKKGSS